MKVIRHKRALSMYIKKLKFTRSGPEYQKEADFHDLPERIFSPAEATLKCSGSGLEEATQIQRKIPVFSRPYFKLAGIRNLLKERLFPKAKIF